MGMLLSVFAENRVFAQEDKLSLIIPASPLPWIIVAILAIAVAVLLGVIFVMTRKAIGEEIRIDQTRRRSIEDSYAAKVRSEYNAKQALLDQKIEQVRQRFS